MLYVCPLFRPLPAGIPAIVAEGWIEVWESTAWWWGEAMIDKVLPHRCNRGDGTRAGGGNADRCHTAELKDLVEV
jgi:hypothetical protein